MYDDSNTKAPNPYEAKQARRKARLEAAADRAGARAESAMRTERAILDPIPLGQPILVGHHSEKRHRAAIRRADAARTRGFAEYKRAKELQRRASGVGTAGISSDDPEAIGKLRAELAKAKAEREAEKKANAALRKLANGAEKSKGGKLSPEDHLALVERLEAPVQIKSQLRSYAIAFPWLPQFQSHTHAKIKRIEERIRGLEARDASPPREPIDGDGWRIEENRELNRVQVHFDARPSKETIARLKSCGFRWAPSETAWQRHLSNGGWYAAQRAVGMIK